MSGDVRKVKKDKEIVVELECQLRDINQQFGEQLKALDHRLEVFLGLVWEMQDYYRRQAEVQSEYARNLEKLSKQISLRHKDNKQKRESWVGYSTYQAWQGLVLNTKQTSKDHAVLSEILNNLASARLGEIGEDMQRIYKKCKDVTLACQADINKVLIDVLNAMKTYQLYHGESQVAENKLLRVQSQKVKVDQQTGGLAKKFVNYEKKSERKQAKYAENKLKALKARNEYLLSIDIANVSLKKYFEEDFPRMVRKMDSGYHLMVSQVLDIHAKSQKILSERDKGRVLELYQRAEGVQGSSDYNMFYNQCQKIFQLPSKIEFQSHKGDEVIQICAQKPVLDEILVRLDQISIRLNKEKELKAEVAKTYEANEKQLFEKLLSSPVSLEQYFDDKSGVSKSPTDKPKEDKGRTEDTFVEMYKENLLRGNLIVRLQTKYDSLRRALGDNVSDHIPITVSHRVGLKKRPPTLPPKPKKKFAEVRPGKEGSRPKLFGGSIEEYVEATGEAIPSIMRSCIRVINIYGMLHQGIFRVSGSVNEMTNYKAMFERGEDPLVDKMDGDDINTVAGLLKMYLRELKEPLFPSEHFDGLLKCCEVMYSSDGEKDWKELLKAILSTLSPQRIVIMRYLFAFLSHVTEYSDENMMEAFNLSICFGPTLVIPSAERTDQHQYQGLINDLVKNIIVHYADLFPPPTQEDYNNNAVYEKYFIGDKDFLGSMSDDDGLKGPVNEEDEDFEDREATVDEVYEAQNERELSCSRGDVVNLLRKENNDYWTVELQNKIGLVPDRVLSIKSTKSGLGLRKSHNLNRSTECLMSTDFISQSNASLSKTSSNHNLSENGVHAPSSAQSSKYNRVSNVSLQSFTKPSNNVMSDHASIAAGLDNILAKFEVDTDKSPGAHHTTTATTRYQQTLVPVLPPLPRPTNMGELLRPTMASIKKRNTSLSSELDVVVTPPSPNEDKTLPAPPLLAHEAVTTKHSSPILGQTKPPTSVSSKWNSLPPNIPPVGSSSSVPVSIPAIPTSSPVVITPKVQSASPSINTSSSSYVVSQQATPVTVQSATLPRQNEKQTSIPPMVRAKPYLPKKRISGMEDRNSGGQENVPKLPAANQPAPLPPIHLAAATTPLNTFGRPIRTSDNASPGSTFLGSVEDWNEERSKFSSFKIPSSAPKKQ